VFSKFAKGGVDHTSYDTTAILTMIEKRFGLAPLSTRDAAQADLATNALNFSSAGAFGGGMTGAGGAMMGTGGAMLRAGGAMTGNGAAMTGTGGGVRGVGGGMMGTGGAMMGTGGATGTGGAMATGPTTADVQAILNANCTSCHSGPGSPRGLDWTNV